MFDIGFSEVFVIAIVALLVLGPERLPRAARFTGLWVRRARAQWYSVKAELESELADEELKRSLQRTQQELRDVRDQLQASGRELQRDLQREGDGITRAVASAADAARIEAPAGDPQLPSDPVDEDTAPGRIGTIDLATPPVAHEAHAPVSDDEDGDDTASSRTGKTTGTGADS